MAHVTNITGKPRLFQSFAVMGVRVFSDSVVTMMFAVDPIIVPLPPKPAPNASAHQSGVMSIPDSPSPLMTGINAIVIGTLSTTADNTATIQITPTPNRTGGTSDACSNSPMIDSITPACSNPPTITKSAPKKDEYAPFNVLENFLKIRLNPDQRNGCRTQRDQ